MTLTAKQKDRLREADEIRKQAKNSNISQQPRFEPTAQGLTSGQIFAMTLKWGKEMLETAPAYQVNSRARDLWLTKFWPNEPYLAGVINSVVQIDRNRGWSLVGGRNQVLRFSDILHNYQVAPGQMGWRSGVGASALSFYTTDMGALVEVGREFENGPMAGLFHVDPTNCTLTGQPETPVTYYPKLASGGRRITTFGSIPFPANDILRINSMTSIDESFNGLGYSALSRCMELALVMTAVWRHEQEVLFARAPKGLLLLRGVQETRWKEAMQADAADLDALEREWFGNVAVFCSGGDVDIDAKIFMLSNLPQGFDQKVFTDLLMCGYALCFGYDVREFWPLSSGALGSAAETVTQHHKATDKGGREFWFGLQEQIQRQLPPTIHFEGDERSAEGDLETAALKKAQADGISAIKAAMPSLSNDQIGELMAEEGLIPLDWTTSSADDTATDTTTQAKKRCLEFPEVQQAIDKYPDEPIVRYHYHDNKSRVQVLYEKGSDAVKKFFPLSYADYREQYDTHSMQKRFGVSMTHAKVSQAVGDYPTIRDNYLTDFVYTVLAYLKGDVDAKTAKNFLKKAILEKFTDAFQTGMVETGGEPYSPEPEDDSWLTSRMNQELAYMDGLFATMKAMKDDKDEPLTLADMSSFAEEKGASYTVTLDGVYGQGKIRGKKKTMLTFDGPDGNESCKTCQKYKGQRHRARWWLSRELIPAPGNDSFDCGCYRCEHQLTDDDGVVWAGTQE